MRGACLHASTLAHARSAQNPASARARRLPLNSWAPDAGCGMEASLGASHVCDSQGRDVRNLVCAFRPHCLLAVTRHRRLASMQLVQQLVVMRQLRVKLAVTARAQIASLTPSMRATDKDTLLPSSMCPCLGIARERLSGQRPSPRPKFEFAVRCLRRRRGEMADDREPGTSEKCANECRVSTRRQNLLLRLDSSHRRSTCPW